jgi:hypothetical protein
LLLLLNCRLLLRRLLSLLLLGCRLLLRAGVAFVSTLLDESLHDSNSRVGTGSVARQANFQSLRRVIDYASDLLLPQGARPQPAL